jgi:uncharacterized protein
VPRHRQSSSLEAFLAAPERPSGTFTYHALQGFLFSIASAPELIRPSEWMPEIFNGGEATYADLAEAQFILPEIMRLYNEVNAAVLAGQDLLPADCTIRRAALSNLEPDAPLSQWSEGFMAGYQWLEETWDGYVSADPSGELSEELGTLVMVLGFFSSRAFAQSIWDEMKSKKSLAATAALMRRLVPKAAAEFAGLGRMIAEAVDAADREAAAPRRVVKTGRNDLCPCGSRRKYKKCCGAAV